MTARALPCLMLLLAAIAPVAPAAAQCRLCAAPSTSASADSEVPVRLEVDTSLDFDRLVLAGTGVGTASLAPDGTRSGSRSTFGEVRVMKAGIKDPIAIQRGIAVYTEVGQRSVSIPINDKMLAAASGPVTVQYVETTETGPQVIAESSAVLR